MILKSTVFKKYFRIFELCEYLLLTFLFYIFVPLVTVLISFRKIFFCLKFITIAFSDLYAFRLLKKHLVTFCVLQVFVEFIAVLSPNLINNKFHRLIMSNKGL